MLLASSDLSQIINPLVSFQNLIVSVARFSLRLLVTNLVCMSSNPLISLWVSQGFGVLEGGEDFGNVSLPREVAELHRERGKRKKVGAMRSKRKSHSGTYPVLATMVEGKVVATRKELMVLSDELSHPYGIMTQERSIVLTGKRLVMVYECLDDVAYFEIAN